MTKYTYDPFWGEHPELLTHEAVAYCEGYEDGYSEGLEYLGSIKALEKENEQLRNLLLANVRVIKAEIKREMAEALADD